MDRIRRRLGSWFGTLLLFLGLLVAALALAVGYRRLPALPSPTPAVIPSTRTPTAQAAGAAPLATQVAAKDGALLVYVPAGAFQMGYEEGDWDERPVRTVTLAGFWIDRSEVSNAQYAQCVMAGACQAPLDRTSRYRSAYYGVVAYRNYPVIWVDWGMADAYCRWAGRRLPTEAEWEKAARGTDARLYPWGERILWSDCTRANYFAEKGACQLDTAPVDALPAGASPYGALNLAGNVAEWVADWYDRYDPADLLNPLGPARGSQHVLRGGSYGNTADQIRATFRSRMGPEWYFYTGFRCAGQ